MEQLAGRFHTCAALAAVLLVAACSDPETTPAERGRVLYERAVGGVACADCHGESAEPRPNPDWRAPGHPLAGVATRETLWGKRFEGPGHLTKAALYCAARFQYRIVRELGKRRAPDFTAVPLSLDERSALVAYLETFEGPNDLVRISRRPNVDPAFDLTGDLDRGERVWLAACAHCHGLEAEGGLGPSLAGDDALDGFTFAEYVRTGTLSDQDGWMPWFSLDRLSDQDLADLIARWAD